MALRRYEHPVIEGALKAGLLVILISPHEVVHTIWYDVLVLRDQPHLRPVVTNYPALTRQQELHRIVALLGHRLHCVGPLR